MEAACAAEGNQGELSRVIAALDRDYADGLFHGGVDDADHSRSELFRGELRRVPLEPLRDLALRAFQIESEISAQETLRLESAEKQVGIGDRGLGAATVADGAGVGSGRFGADSERSGGVEAGDRTS